jgi:hypothetical protein
VAEGMTATQLAEDLGFLQDDDVRQVLTELVDLHDEVIPAELCAEVRSILNPNGERTAPAPLYWPGHRVSWAGKSPTDGEGDYPVDW